MLSYTVVLLNGKSYSPDCLRFLADFDDRSSNLLFTNKEISDKFLNLTLKERIEYFEIYLEYFLRAIYNSCEVDNDQELSKPVIDKITLIDQNKCELITTKIQGSGTEFTLSLIKSPKDDLLSIKLQILSAIIGFSKDEMNTIEVFSAVCGAIKNVTNSINSLNPEIAIWYYMQGIDLIC